MQSYVADKLLATASKKDKGEILRSAKETIAYVTMEKDREMEEAVERAIADYGRGLNRAVSEAKVKFKAEVAENMGRFVEEDVSALRKRHDLETTKIN